MIGQLRQLAARIMPKMITRAMSTQKGRSKTFRLACVYGEKPLLSSTDYETAEQSNQLTELSFKPIRFAKIDENNSILYDADYERFLRNTMKDGRKDLWESMMHECFYLIKTYQLRKKMKQSSNPQTTDANVEREEIITDPMVIFHQALENCKPLVITRKIRRGGATYQVPFPLTEEESKWYSLKWLISSVLERPKPRKKRFFEAMAQELIDAANNQGKVIKRRDDMHRLAEANKAYSHYRWG